MDSLIAIVINRTRSFVERCPNLVTAREQQWHLHRWTGPEALMHPEHFIVRQWLSSLSVTQWSARNPMSRC
eukprot:scaffold136951_cov73-Attheya_sp.AAC.2